MLCSAPFFYAVLVLAQGSIYNIYVLVFFALFFINLNWALVGDILLVRVPLPLVKHTFIRLYAIQL